MSRAFDRASAIVRANRELMEQWSQKLLEKETLDDEELKVLAGSVARAA